MTIRTVVHAELPYLVEACLQGSGWAGWDGKPAECVLLYGLEDLAFAEGGGLGPGKNKRGGP